MSELKQKIQYIKQELAIAFSDDNYEKAWYRWLEHTITIFLLLNAAEAFLSTYDSISEQYGTLLNIIDVLTTVVFFIEVSLRIWVADLQNERYKGVRGRIRYCLTPLGLIDAISTYPCMIGLFCGFSPIILKSLRVLRLVRIFRFMKAFRLLGNALSHKKEELLLSVGCLTVITFMLSLVLFFVEHNADPDRYINGLDSMIWAFMQYIEDPGNFAEYGPITFAGRVISCIVGVLGIAVFAVPAGLIGSGFIEEVEANKEERANIESTTKIRQAFLRLMCRYTRFQTVPIFLTIPQLQVLTRLDIEQIMSAIESTNDLRLVNLAQCKNIEDEPVDQLAVEHFPVNRSYGCCINRGSNVTIVETSSFVEVGMGNFAFYLAMIGGFNYMSREIGAVRPYQSYYTFKDESLDPHLPEFMADLNSMAYAEDHYVFYILAASGGMEPKLPTQVHFNYGGQKGDETYDDPNRALHNTKVFESFFHDVSKDLRTQLEFIADKQRYYNTSSPNNIMRKLKYADKVNSVSVRVKWPFVCCDLRRYELAKVLADNMKKHFEKDATEEYDPLLSIKGIGYTDYNIPENEDTSHML